MTQSIQEFWNEGWRRTKVRAAVLATVQDVMTRARVCRFSGAGEAVTNAVIKATTIVT